MDRFFWWMKTKTTKPTEPSQHCAYAALGLGDINYNVFNAMGTVGMKTDTYDMRWYYGSSGQVWHDGATGGRVSYVDLSTWTGVPTSAALHFKPGTPVTRAMAFLREARAAVKARAVSPITNPRHVSISDRVLSCHSSDVTMMSYWKFNNLLVKCQKNVTSITFVPGLQDSTWSAAAICFLCVIGVTNYRRVSDPSSWSNARWKRTILDGFSSGHDVAGSI